ncbi:MAG: hypothetical protein ACOX0H_01990 [Patescibacteria group bacterium]|jgi:hypothetical protein|nr:hypothetical protein [Patescibacteria group bacterium]MDD4444106.1 hypothetical protein [Patescibacteria group bacterium]
MEISKELPSFEKKKALIIVTGKQSAKLFVVNNGELNLLQEFDIPTPSSEYTDNEGHFKSRGEGGYIASGSVREPKKEYLFDKFSSKLTEVVVDQDSLEKIQEIYLFTPEYMKNELKDSFPNIIQEKIVMEFYGNFGDQHVFELLKMIQEKGSEESMDKITPISKKAQKILDKNID